MDGEIKKHLERLLPTLTIVIGLLGVYLLVNHILPILKVSVLMLLGALTPFILALLVAILIDPIVNYLENRIRVPRSIAVIFSLLFVFGLFLVFLILVSSRMIIELMQLSDVLPSINKYLIDEGWQVIKEIRAFISSNPLPPEVQQSAQDNLAQIFNTIGLFLGKFTEILVAFLAILPLIFTILIVAAVATFFISKDKEKITNYLINLIPVKLVLPLNKLFNTMTRTFTGFLRAQVTLISMTAIQAIIGLYLLGIEYPLTIGFLVGIVDLIPILGPGSVFIPWSFWHIIVGNYKFAIALLVLYGILAIVRQLLEPKILGASIGLHPLATLMSIFIGLRLMGLAGIIIGPLTLILFKIFLEAKNFKGDS